MKRTIQLFSLVVIASLLSGCFLKSVHPLVKKEDAIKISGIEGTWEGEDQRWTFTRDDDIVKDEYIKSDMGASFIFNGEDTSNNREKLHEYFVIYEELEDGRADSSYFTARFVELNENLYLDLYPVDLEETDLYALHFVPVHTFARVNHAGDSLDISLFQDDWIEEQINDNRVRIKHEKTENGILVTASTNELQKFIIKYGEMDEAYEVLIALKRKF